MKNKYFLLMFMFSIVAAFAQNNVNINVTDATMMGIETADVTFDGATLATDSNGDVTFISILDGSYNYSISKDCFEVATGSITVAGAEIFESVMLMTRTTNNIFWFVGSAGSPAPFVGATITITDGVGYTNSFVNSLLDDSMSDVPYGTYDYTIEKDCFETVTGQVTVECTPSPNQGVSVFTTGGAAAVIDISVTQNAEMLTANVSGVDITYQWVDCDNGNAPIDGETNQMFSATTNGNYAVIITNTNCAISDTSACYEVNTLSLETLENPFTISVYPNPVVNNVNIALGKTYQDINVQIFSITGQLINNVYETNSIQCKIDMSNLPTGNYILRINADGNSKSSIVIKK